MFHRLSTIPGHWRVVCFALHFIAVCVRIFSYLNLNLRENCVRMFSYLNLNSRENCCNVFPLSLSAYGCLGDPAYLGGVVAWCETVKALKSRID